MGNAAVRGWRRAPKRLTSRDLRLGGRPLVGSSSCISQSPRCPRRAVRTRFHLPHSQRQKQSRDRARPLAEPEHISRLGGVPSLKLALWPTVPAEEAVGRQGATSATRQRTIEANGI